MAQFEVLALDKTNSRARAPGSGDSYLMPRSLAVGGETVTASAPVLDLSQSWNNNLVTFTGIKFNVVSDVSAAGSLLMDLQVGGVSKFKVSKDGTIDISGPTAGILFNDNSSSGIKAASSAGNVKIGNLNGFGLAVFNNAINVNVSAPATLTSDQSHTLAQRNGVNAQTFRLYNTYTDASNYERGFLQWNSNVLEIGTESGGTGVTRNISLQKIGGRSRFIIDTSGNGDARNTLTLRTASGYDPELYSPYQMYFTTGPGGFFYNQSIKVLNSGNANQASTYGYNYIYFVDYINDSVIKGHTRNIDEPIKALIVTGGNPPPSAATNLTGGELKLVGGSGASSSAGAANGGNIYIRGGKGYGTGHNGYVIMDNLPTSNPAVTGALWNDAGMLKVSAG